MEQCIFKNKNCGIHKPSRDPRVLFSINESDKSCKNHLVSIKILQSYDETADITEKELIESRSNKSLDNHQSDKICNYHRYEYGVYWRPSRKCQHLLHTKKGKCNTGTATFISAVGEGHTFRSAKIQFYNLSLISLRGLLNFVRSEWVIILTCLPCQNQL